FDPFGVVAEGGQFGAGVLDVEGPGEAPPDRYGADGGSDAGDGKGSTLTPGDQGVEVAADVLSEAAGEGVEGEPGGVEALGEPLSEPLRPGLDLVERPLGFLGEILRRADRRLERAAGLAVVAEDLDGDLPGVRSAPAAANRHAVLPSSEGGVSRRVDVDRLEAGGELVEGVEVHREVGDLHLGADAGVGHLGSGDSVEERPDPKRRRLEILHLDLPG